MSFGLKSFAHPGLKSRTLPKRCQGSDSNSQTTTIQGQALPAIADAQRGRLQGGLVASPQSDVPVRTLTPIPSPPAHRINYSFEMTQLSRKTWGLAWIAAAVLACQIGSAREIHVAKTGNDGNPGSVESPYLTIGKSAEEAQPGDTVVVHAGTYREWVKPRRGGRDESRRIVYRAAAGEDVLVKGSEQIASWVNQGGGVWIVQLPQRFFGAYNPYALNLSGGWLHYGQWLHRGDVYLNGEALCERKSPEEVKQQANTWCCRATDANTTIWANFGKANPNALLAEINVRESVFMPAQSGLGYIVVSAFTSCTRPRIGSRPA